ncbi:hypothetical protein FE257_011625 [Aspergillus nanangensis]|uniref:Uncharacterized protein n=1 Tax=Aspergillus nanangensis TaxID=2582783 RepID=A0AAD4GXR2_ASPNN|nr:hypothetical protein FE257_011625 [Aspergillus nanangensis]
MPAENDKQPNSLPKYAPPTTGILSYLPRSWVPYAELIRIDRPQGVFITNIPCLIGLMYGANIASTKIEATSLLKQAAKLSLTILAFRSAGCAWNDIIDQDVDRKTARCAIRPVARGAISTTHGCIYTALLVGAAFLPLQTMPQACTTDALITTMLIGIYPFCKRITHFVQIVLGLTLSSTVFLATHSLGADPWTDRTRISTVGVMGSIALMAAFYDVLYACGDVEDDMKSGVKGLAVLFRNQLALLLSVLASGVGLCFYIAASRIGMAAPYVTYTVGGSSLALALMIVLSQTDRKGTCFGYLKWFYMMGYLSLLGGLLGNYLETAEYV